MMGMERLLNDACDDFEKGRGVWEEFARQSEDITNIPENEIKDTHTHPIAQERRPAKQAGVASGAEEAKTL